MRYSAARACCRSGSPTTSWSRWSAAGDSPDDRVQDAVARSRRRCRAYVEDVWPEARPAGGAVGLLRDPEVLAAAADGCCTDDEQRILLWERPPRSRGAARWIRADMALLDELADLLDRTPSLGHVVLDEAQDLSPMQLRAVGRRASTGSLTVLGDIAQGTTPWATDVVGGVAGAPRPALSGEQGCSTAGSGCPASVIDYAARLLPSMAPGLAPPRSVRDNPGRLDVVRAGRAPGPGAVVAAVGPPPREAGSVGVIAPDAEVPASAPR